MHFNSIRIAITKAELNQFAQELDRESMITLELPTYLRNYATSIFSPERSSIKLIKTRTGQEFIPSQGKLQTKQNFDFGNIMTGNLAITSEAYAELVDGAKDNEIVMALEVRNPKHISIYSNIKSGKINYYVYQKKENQQYIITQPDDSGITIRVNGIKAVERIQTKNGLIMIKSKSKGVNLITIDANSPLRPRYMLLLYSVLLFTLLILLMMAIAEYNDSKA